MSCACGVASLCISISYQVQHLFVTGLNEACKRCFRLLTRLVWILHIVSSSNSSNNHFDTVPKSRTRRRRSRRAPRVMLGYVLPGVGVIYTYIPLALGCSVALKLSKTRTLSLYQGDLAVLTCPLRSSAAGSKHFVERATSRGAPDSLLRMLQTYCALP